MSTRKTSTICTPSILENLLVLGGLFLAGESVARASPILCAPDLNLFQTWNLLNALDGSVKKGLCVQDERDPFDPAGDALIADGKYKGQCNATDAKRSVRVLSDSEGTAYQPRQEILVANVSHNGKFWVARIPRFGKYESMIQIEHFKAVVPAAHTQLRIRAKDAASRITLIPQIADGTPPVTLDDLILSVEYIAPKGVPYDVVKGLDRDNFGMAYRVTSLEDTVKTRVIRDRHKIEQYPLSLDEEEVRQTLAAYFSTATRSKLNKRYHSIDANCSTEVVEAVLQGRRQGKRKTTGASNAADWLREARAGLARSLVFYPILLAPAADAIGLLDSKQQIPDLTATGN